MHTHEKLHFVTLVSHLAHQQIPEEHCPSTKYWRGIHSNSNSSLSVAQLHMGNSTAKSMLCKNASNKGSGPEFYFPLSLRLLLQGLIVSRQTNDLVNQLTCMKTETNRKQIIHKLIAKKQIICKLIRLSNN